jgi:hypothetical protein
MASPYKINKSTSITNNSGSTSKTTGALTVTGGISSQENVILGGYLGITGASNIVNLKVQNATSAYNYNLPSSSGSSGEILASGGGGSSPMTWKSVTGSGSIVMSFAPTFGAGTVTFGGSIDVSANTNSQSATFSNYIGITGTSASYANKRITSSSDHSLLFCADRAAIGSYSFCDSTATTNYININTSSSVLEANGNVSITASSASGIINSTNSISTAASIGTFYAPNMGDGLAIRNLLGKNSSTSAYFQYVKTATSATTSTSWGIVGGTVAIDMFNDNRINLTGALTATSIQNTPIGSTTANTASFTDLVVTQNSSSFDGILRVINTTTLSSSIANFLTPGLASGNASTLIWGKANSSNQAAYISFGYDSTASAIYSTWGFANATPANFISLRGDGTISLSGGTSITGALSVTGQITTTVITGTSPFSVSSTTVVPNLNVSQLLGATWTAPGTIGSTTPNTGSFTTLSSTGQITTTVNTGTAPFSVSSTTVVPNLNVSQLLGATWAAPGTIGSTTPNTGSFTALSSILSGSVSGIPITAYIPSLSNGNSVQLYLGVAAATHNTGIIQFNYTSSGSTSNSIGLGFYGSNNIMNITSAGNVGIGTTSPGSSLHIAGSIPSSPVGNGIHQGIDSSNYAAIQLNSSIGGYIDFGVSGGDYQARITSTSGNITFQSNSGSGAYIHLSNGGVSINNTSPSYSLDVTGTGRFTGGVWTPVINADALTASGGGSTISAADATLKLGNGGSGGNHLYVGYTGGNVGWLQSTYFGFNAFYDMALNPLGGNIGIGNVSPTYTLDVTGSFRSNGVGSGISVFGANSGTNNSIKVLSAIGNIEMGVSNGTGSFVSSANSGDAFIKATTSKGIVLQGNAGAGAYAYVSNGGVGINNISPSHALDVNGTLSVSNGTVKGKTITVGGSTNNVIISTSGSFQFFISWDSGAGYAFGFITSSNSTTTIIYSSNSAGGNSSIDTTNSFASNSGNGISIFYNVGDIVLQTKTNYSGGAITTTLIGA